MVTQKVDLGHSQGQIIQQAKVDTCSGPRGAKCRPQWIKGDVPL